MKKGHCPKCTSEKVVVSAGKGGVGFADSLISILFGRGWAGTQKWITYLCLNCGYFENYVEDREKLDQIQVDPEKRGWKNVK